MLEQLDTVDLINTLPVFAVKVPLVGLVDFTTPVAAFLTFVIVRTVFWVLQTVILHHAGVLAAKTKGEFDDVLVGAFSDIRTWVYNLVALFIALKFFDLSETVNNVVTGLFYFAVVWQLIEIATKLLDYLASTFMYKDEDADGVVDPSVATASHLITLIARILMWALGVLFVLSNLGIEVSSLLAGMGIGGIAIAFALQGVLGDLFASFSLYFDKPFRVGDFIIIGTDSGTVERIGIKTTRIRTLQGEELVVSNTELTTARVQNFKKMEKRRIVTRFGITYETAQDKVKQVPEVVTQIFEQLEYANLDRVHFASYGDSALIFELVYFVESSEYVVYMNSQQDFNFKLMERFAELGINFAYPTQTIYTKTIN